MLSTSHVADELAVANTAEADNIELGELKEGELK